MAGTAARPTTISREGRGSKEGRTSREIVCALDASRRLGISANAYHRVHVEDARKGLVIREEWGVASERARKYFVLLRSIARTYRSVSKVPKRSFELIERYREGSRVESYGVYGDLGVRTTPKRVACTAARPTTRPGAKGGRSLRWY